MRYRGLPRKFRVALVYCVFSILWIVVTDRVTSYIATDVNSATWIGIVKGIAFVVASTLLIYFLLRADERRQSSLQTEVKLLQDSFAVLFDKNPQPMWVNDPETLQFIAVNEATLQTFGYGREEFLSLYIDNLIDAAELDKLIKDYSQHQEGLRRLGPWKMSNRAGEALYAYIVMVDVEYSGRKANMSTLMDISEQKIMEETLKRTTTERDEFEAFGFSVSHDLRASLRAVDGYSRILQEEYRDTLDAVGYGYLEKIHQASLTMNQTIDNLLMLSGITHRKVHFEKIDLSQMAREIAAELQKDDTERQVSFEIAESMPVYADAELMHILLFDLLENAWKYTSKKPAAHIQFDMQTQEESTVYFVKDDGAGFDPQKVTHMFQPFQRFHPATDFKGSGIGLSVVARIIDRHCGKVWAEGKVNEGATFYFTLHATANKEDGCA